jgi:hypothetical protein
MANRTADRMASSTARARAVTRHDYALQPVRSRVARFLIWTTACVLFAASGAAAMAFVGGQRVLWRDVPCVAVTPKEASGDDTLDRARLALAQESASRAAVQKSADTLAAEVGQLKAQVLFLQGQGRAPR